jgi:hypothetical protein
MPIVNFIDQMSEPTVSQSPSFIDGSILDIDERLETFRDDVKMNRIEFFFPDGLAEVDLKVECKALTQLKDFETMYDYTMQAMEKKGVVINIINYDGTRTEIARFYVPNKFMYLRDVPAIRMYPQLITWLTEFMAAYIGRKFPMPAETGEKTENEKTEEKPRKTRKKASKKTEKLQKEPEKEEPL